jgi:hypothetical protein
MPSVVLVYRINEAFLADGFQRPGRSFSDRSLEGAMSEVFISTRAKTNPLSSNCTLPWPPRGAILGGLGGH